ncbi:hypothetical protein EDD85DRAFT_168769 [Armillaria nabsnona]|nr:hypothetical protein EDD85DRAFT_168769 [Armillaria nabsnona]
MNALCQLLVLSLQLLSICLVVHSVHARRYNHHRGASAFSCSGKHISCIMDPSSMRLNLYFPTKALTGNMHRLHWNFASFVLSGSATDLSILPYGALQVC